MGNFSPRNVSQLLVASATADQLVAVGDYVITPIADPDTASGALANLGARVQVKTTGGTKVSDFIPANAVYKGATGVAAIDQVVTSTYPDVSADVTYVGSIDIHDGIGSMLNDRFIKGYVVIDKDGAFIGDDGVKVASATLTEVLAELALKLQAGVDRSNEGYLVTSTATEIVVTGTQPGQRIGATDGIAVPFDYSGGVKDTIDSIAQGSFYSEAAVTVLTVASKASDLTQLKNIEWFNSGYDKDPYREIGSFASFEADSNITAAGIAETEEYGIFQFYKDRDATNIERQHRQLIVVGDGAAALAAVLVATTA